MNPTPETELPVSVALTKRIKTQTKIGMIAVISAIIENIFSSFCVLIVLI